MFLELIYLPKVLFVGLSSLGDLSLEDKYEQITLLMEMILKQAWDYINQTMLIFILCVQKYCAITDESIQLESVRNLSETPYEEFISRKISYEKERWEISSFHK